MEKYELKELPTIPDSVFSEVMDQLLNSGFAVPETAVTEVKKLLSHEIEELNLLGIDEMSIAPNILLDEDAIRKLALAEKN